MNLPCDVCGENLAALKDLRRGWVSWWMKDDLVVEQFHVTCSGSCFRSLETQLRHEGFRVGDHHLSVFTGRNAMWRMQSLLRNYDWPPRSVALLRMLDFFVVAELLRTTEHGTSSREMGL